MIVIIFHIAEELRALSVPSTAILPFVFTEVIGPDILSLSASVDRVGIPQTEEDQREPLPVVNIPNVEMGIAPLDESLTPGFVINPEAANLFDEWGVPRVKVERTGEVQEPISAKVPGDISLVIYCIQFPSASIVCSVIAIVG